MATSKVTQVTADADFSHHIANLPASALAVIYFHAPWAAPCQQMASVIEALASTYPVESPPSISFLSLNAEELPDISEQYDVTAVPFIVLQRNGQTLETVSGSDASKVRAAVERHAGRSGNAGKTGLLPPQTVTPREQPATGNGAAPEATNGVKNLGNHVPMTSDAAAPESASQPSKEEIFQRLEGLTKAAPVMLFMKGTPSAPQCGFSRKTVAMLRERTIRYGFFNILADDEVRQGLKEYADWPTFPQLWVDGELVGGLDIVQEEFENNPEYLNEYSAKPQAATA